MDNKDLVRRFIERVFEAGDADAVDQLISDDFVSHTFGITENPRDMLRVTAERVHASLSDVAFEIEDMVAEGDRVAVRLTASATPIGEFMGKPATGKGYRIGEMHFFRCSDGRIVEHWHQYDALGMQKQLS